MFPWLSLVVMTALAGLSLRILSRQVFPALGHVQQGELVVDVWLPLALVVPLLFMIEGVDGSVSVVGWPAIGGPVMVGLLGLAIGAMAGRGGIGLFGEEFAEGESIRWRLAPRLTITSLLSGLILLLLGGAHVMTMWIGQCAFAVAAVMLWINTPEVSNQPARSQDAVQLRVGFGMVFVLLCAFGLGFVGRLAGSGEQWPIVLVMLIHAAAALVLAARQGSGGLCVRIAIWSGGFGVLFAMGVLAILAMVPRILITLLGIELPPHSMRIASGFGAFALEATLLMVLTPIAVGVLRLPGALRVAAGAASLGIVLVRLLLWVVATSDDVAV